MGEVLVRPWGWDVKGELPFSKVNDGLEVLENVEAEVLPIVGPPCANDRGGVGELGSGGVLNLEQ